MNTARLISMKTFATKAKALVLLAGATDNIRQHNALFGEIKLTVGGSDVKLMS